MLAQHHQYMNICQHTTTPTQTAISFISFTLSFCLLHRIPHTPASARHRNKRNSCTIPASPSSSVLFLRCNKNLGAYSVSKPTAYGVSLQRQQAYSVSVSLQQQRQPTASASAYSVSKPTASASLQRQQAYSLRRQPTASASLQRQRQPTATASAYSSSVSLLRQPPASATASAYSVSKPTASASLQRQRQPTASARRLHTLQSTKYAPAAQCRPCPLLSSSASAG